MASLEGRFASGDEERILKEAAAELPTAWVVAIVRTATSPLVEVIVLRGTEKAVRQSFNDPRPESMAEFIVSAERLNPS